MYGLADDCTDGDLRRSAAACRKRFERAVKRLRELAVRDGILPLLGLERTRNVVARAKKKAELEFDALLRGVASAPPIPTSWRGVKPMVGQTVGNYRIQGRIGIGGMGIVYSASDLRLERKVAIKMLPAARAHDPIWRDMFQREARSIAAVNHENVATIHELGEWKGELYIVMEYVNGRSLAEIIDAGDLTADRVLSLAHQLALGLATAHEAGIIHRDVKPENILVTVDDRLKILDFGVASSVRARGPGDDHGGTHRYMSPEARDGKSVDERADVYAFGLVVLKCSTR